MIAIRCNTHANQQDLVRVLADEGYKVWVKKAKINFGLNKEDSYVCFEQSQKGDQNES